MARPRPELVLFDLDHTLVRCDSFAAFGRHLLVRQWYRAVVIGLASPLLIPLWMVRRTQRLAASAFVWVATVGHSDAEFEDVMLRHVQARYGESHALVCRPAVQALQTHRANGDRTIVVTGAPTDLARRVCDAIGVTDADVEIVGSCLRRAWGGWIAGEHCHGSHKVRMLARIGVVRADYVYTDSASDLPMLRLGAKRVMVNPEPRHLARAVAELEGTVDVVTWRAISRLMVRSTRCRGEWSRLPARRSSSLTLQIESC